MEVDIKLDTMNLAAEMAIGLAILHWQAQVDGMDVEFVLGGAAPWDSEMEFGYDDLTTQPDRVESVIAKRRQIHFYMLDFDKAAEIKLTVGDVKKKLVPAFLGNDPYYPRPQLSQGLWEMFCDTYLKASEIILERKGVKQQVKKLPKLFLEEVIRVMEEHENWSEEKNISFG